MLEMEQILYLYRSYWKLNRFLYRAGSETGPLFVLGLGEEPWLVLYIKSISVWLFPLLSQILSSYSHWTSGVRSSISYKKPFLLSPNETFWWYIFFFSLYIVAIKISCNLGGLFWIFVSKGYSTSYSLFRT